MSDIVEHSGCCIHWERNDEAYDPLWLPYVAADLWLFSGFRGPAEWQVPCSISAIMEELEERYALWFESGGERGRAPSYLPASATTVTGRLIHIPELFPGGQPEEWLHRSYCGPGSYACCMGRDCHTRSIMSCWGAGGATIPTGLQPIDDPQIPDGDLTGMYLTTWVASCMDVICGDMTRCCLILADGTGQCRLAASPEQCLDIYHWDEVPPVVETYIVPDGISCLDVCGNDDPWWPGDPTPYVCCLCGGYCLVLPSDACRELDGISVRGYRNCLDAGAVCFEIDTRPSCETGTWAVVPSSEDPEQYDLLSTAPIWIEDYPDQTVLQHHYAHVGEDPWLCHRWDDPRNMYEKSICGVALNEGGNLGNCIPEGHGAIICGWQPPCPELV